MHRPADSNIPPHQRDEGFALLAAAAGLVAGLLTAVAAAAETPPGSGHLEEARRELESGRDSRAVFHLRRHLDRLPDDTEARSLLAVAYEGLGLRGPALRELHLVLAERPDDPGALRVLVKVQRDSGQREEALETLRRLRGDGLHEPELDLIEGELLFRLGRHAEAAAPLERSLTESADSLRTLKLHGLNALQLGLLPEARWSLGRAAELAPDDAAVRNSLGFALERLGEVEAAYLEYLEAEGRSGGKERYAANRQRLEKLLGRH